MTGDRGRSRAPPPRLGLDDLRRDLAELHRAVAVADRLDALTPDVADRVRRVLEALEHGVVAWRKGLRAGGAIC
jgi:hypothetical protein